MLKYQHHVCFNDVPKSCLSVSSGDRQSRKGNHAKYNSYTDLLSIQLLLYTPDFFKIANCADIVHMFTMLYIF